MKTNKLFSIASLAIASALLLSGCAGTASTTESNTSVSSSTVYTEPAGGSMFVVEGKSAKISGTAGDYTLTISDVNADTTWFTDRPMRDAGNTETSTLPALWTEDGTNSFKNTPPNATLTVNVDNKSETLVGEISEPSLNGSTLSFKVKPIAELNASLVGKTLSNPVLLIDATATSVTVGQPTICTANTYCDIYIEVTNTSGEEYIGSGEISTPPWYVDNPVTVTLTLSNTTQSLGFTPTGGWSSGTVANGVVTTTTSATIAAGGTAPIQLAWAGDEGTYQDFTVVSCTSSIGTCSVG